MKKFFISLLVISAVFAFQSCEEDDELTFTAAPSEMGVAFTNSFSNEYLLSEETENNTAERFVWEPADFGAPTNVTYELQASIDPNFGDFDVVGSTTETNQAVSVGQLLDFADDLGLDSDPTTTDENGNPNNIGTVHFRLRAFAGAGTGNNTEMISDVSSLNITVIEETPDGTCPSLWVVGAGAPEAGWNWGSPIELTCSSDVLSATFQLANDAFRFFTEEGNWDSGLNYPYYEGEGYTIDTLLENAMDGDSNFRFIGEPGLYDVVVDDVAKTIVVTKAASLWLVGAATPGGWSWDAPTEAPQVSTGVYQTTLDFTNETFRFFTVEGDWGSGLNYPYYVGEGYDIDSNFEDGLDGDNNFRFIGTPGTYTVTVNDNDKTITLE